MKKLAVEPVPTPTMASGTTWAIAARATCGAGDGFLELILGHGAFLLREGVILLRTELLQHVIAL